MPFTMLVPTMNVFLSFCTVSLYLLFPGTIFFAKRGYRFLRNYRFLRGYIVTSRCFLAMDIHIRVILLKTVVINEHDTLHFRDSVPLLNYYPLKIPQNRFTLLSWSSGTGSFPYISKGAGVTVKLISIPWINVLPSNYLLINNYFPSTFLLVNKYSLQEISTPFKIIWNVVFSHLNNPGNSIFLGKMHSLVKPLLE